MHTNAMPALVLNADFQPLSYFPLSVWDFGHTLRKVVCGRVSVVEEYRVELRSQRFDYRPPSVVALRNYVAPPKRVVFTRFNVFLRDRFRCQYCGGAFTAKELTFEHVIPRSRGGKTAWNNIVAACEPCNVAKDDKLRMKPMRAPREPTPSELLAAKRCFPPNFLHESWADFLYWDVELES
jgi:5-methylcytosine-specific restriction endonuclease McrA